MEDLYIGLLLIFAFITFIMGLWLGNPNELENGCIIHNDKIYCEVVNE